MYKRDIYLDIDDELNNYIKSVELDSNSRVWHFHLTVDYEPLDLTGKSVHFMAEKPDKTNVLNECRIVDAERGVVEVKLTRQANAIPGHVKCLLKIIGDEGFVLKTKTFVVDVSKTLSDDAIVSSDEFGTLEAALGKVQDIDNRFAQTNAQLSNVYNDINNRISQNKQFSFTFGTSTWFGEHSDGGKAKLEKMLMYFDTTIQCLKIKYDDVKGSFVSPSSENIAEQVQAYNDYINNGGKTFGIKFHQTGEKMKDLFDKHGSKKICEEYSKYVINFIHTLPYKNHIENVWIMNEAGVDAFGTSYETDIINAINLVKAAGYKVSTPYANAYAIADSSQKIVMANDFISLNCYPFNDYLGKRSNIRDVAERFDKEFAIVERYLNKKDLYITEFGCSSSWRSFSYPPSYYQDGESTPIALFIEGFFQSRFMGNVKGAWYWYHHDAMTYASNTLLSVKYDTEVRYG